MILWTLYVVNVGLADVIANDFWTICFVFGRCYCHIVISFLQPSFCLTDVIAMLLGYMMDGDVVTIRVML